MKGVCMQMEGWTHVGGTKEPKIAGTHPGVRAVRPDWEARRRCWEAAHVWRPQPGGRPQTCAALVLRRVQKRTGVVASKGERGEAGGGAGRWLGWRGAFAAKWSSKEKGVQHDWGGTHAWNM
jgi:hypothetical protein